MKMIARTEDPIETTQTMLADGFRVVDVDSTDDELVLTLWNGSQRHAVVFDREAAKRLVVADLVTRRPLIA